MRPSRRARFDDSPNSSLSGTTDNGLAANALWRFSSSAERRSCPWTGGHIRGGTRRPRHRLGCPDAAPTTRLTDHAASALVRSALTSGPITFSALKGVKFCIPTKGLADERLKSGGRFYRTAVNLDRRKSYDRFAPVIWMSGAVDCKKSGNVFVKHTHRRVVVLSCLVTVLTLTSALLLALAPAPLAPDAASSLFALEAPESMDVIFQTDALARPGRWKYIYIHHSKTTNGNAVSLGQQPGGMRDHFVIGNGDGAVDGEIQLTQRWNKQEAAMPPSGASFDDRFAADIISICIVGDFDRTVPTPTQLRRLSQLVGTLQGRLRIGPNDIWMQEVPGTPAGIGRYFPATAFREQLLP